MIGLHISSIAVLMLLLLLLLLLYNIYIAPYFFHSLRRCTSNILTDIKIYIICLYFVYPLIKKEIKNYDLNKV